MMPPNECIDTTASMAALASEVKAWGIALGFADIRITDCDLAASEPKLQAWLDAGYHGEMAFMSAHGTNRSRPAELVPGTRRIILARMNYLPVPSCDTDIAPKVEVSPAKQASAKQASAKQAESNHQFSPTNLPFDWRLHEATRLQEPAAAVISIYARGRDYHKVMRQRLQQLAQKIENAAGSVGYRVFTDSAPVMEVALAQKAGLGWRGKHTLLLNREAGSMFFLGEIYTDLPLPIDAPITDHCGTCNACISVCPTQAIIAPYVLDARRCISYLTIELKGSIPVELRPLIGNRVYGCDDCQVICPWNKFAQSTALEDFKVRNGLDQAMLVDLFLWTAAEFEQRLQGSAIRRIGYERWLRNIAVGLGNALRCGDSLDSVTIQAALQKRMDDPSALVREHVKWALDQLVLSPSMRDDQSANQKQP
jgi:epoxyqueuosine reductase